MANINWSNVTDLGQLPSLANTASNGTFWVGMLHMLWIILIMVMIGGYGFEIALLTASFLGLILALVMVYAGLVSWIFALEFTGIILFLFLYIIWSGKKQVQ